MVILLIFSIVRGVSKNNDRKGDTDPAAVETTEVENIIVGISSADAIGKNFSEIESQLRDAGFTNIEIHNNRDIKKDSEYEEVTINGITWKKYHATDMGVYDTYDYIYNNGLYRIELNAVDKYADEFNEFMKDVSFE